MGAGFRQDSAGLRRQTDERVEQRLASRLQRISRYRFGLAAEWLSCLMLRLKGYSILDRRYRTPVGEIDIIARRGRRLAFIEVKCRARCDDAVSSLTPRQQQRIVRAAAVWQKRHPRYSGCEPAFDLCASGDDGRWWLPVHIPDAFDPVLPPVRSSGW